MVVVVVVLVTVVVMVNRHCLGWLLHGMLVCGLIDRSADGTACMGWWMDGWMDDITTGVPGRANDEKQAAIRAFHEHADNINSIYVGNEDLQPVGPFTVDDIINHIDGE